MNNIALFSAPRSGSSWLGQILNSSPEVAYRFQPNFAYSFPYELSNESTANEIDVFFDELLHTLDPFVNAEISISRKKNIQFEKSKIKALVFKETHYINSVENLLKNSDTKVIGLVRSPFPVISSWLKIPKEFDPQWIIKDEWENAQSKNQNKVTHFFGYNKWKETIALFLKMRKEHPTQFYLISYDDLLQNTETEVRKLFKFCNINFCDQTETFIKKSTSNMVNDDDAYSVFKSKKKDDAWKNDLPKYIEEEIKADKEFKKFNLHFNWI
ncbi:sulfotransferase domain-containing protein [Aequorivita capsosiphonis]|uniref:sulfotransferase domain-containing protein n=1 Tax=Aequorivita capsosiphonis TaxID=487317 RepID=UPI00040D345F|nr:sulfotransferase domain-containing protein [Aequorivita capsosiphonis]